MRIIVRVVNTIHTFQCWDEHSSTLESGWALDGRWMALDERMVVETSSTRLLDTS